MLKTWRSLKFLFTGPLILLMLVVINATVAHGHWLKWAVLGIGIAWVLSLLRVIRAVILLGGLAALLAYFQKQRNPIR